MTNLAALTPRQVVSIYQKRWAIELMHWELTSEGGLGQHQVSGVQTTLTSRLASRYWPTCLYCGCVITRSSPGQPWSIFQLQHALRLRAMTNQIEHKVKVKMAKTGRLPKALCYGYKVSILSQEVMFDGSGFLQGKDSVSQSLRLR